MPQTHATHPNGISFLPSLTTLLLLLAAVHRHGAAQIPGGGGTVRSGKLSFDGRATLGDFTGTTTTLTGELTGGPDLASVRGWVEAPVAMLNTGNGKRDTDLNKSMESAKFPVLRFELTGVTQETWSGDTATVTLHGRFRIHGVERPAELAATVVLGADQVRLQATTPMNLKDYRIGGLTKMFGMLRMHEDIVVHVALVFEVGSSAHGQATVP